MVENLLISSSLGILIASPQLWYAFRYYPRSIRVCKTSAEKQAIGSIPPSKLILGLVWPTSLSRYGTIDGVFFPECVSFIGLGGILLACLGTNGFWWALLFLAGALALGRHTPVFRSSSWFHLRIPARYCYFVGLGLAFLALDGFRLLPERGQRLVLLLQGLSLLLTLPRLWPMLPYVQRWERPSQVFNTPLTRFLSGEGFRVSGLPYPLRTGQVNRIKTLGYNGGSQAQWMQRFRQDHNPNGSGAHDWFALNEDGDLLDWYGVKYAYTFRTLGGTWRKTEIPHLYENTRLAKNMIPPTWKEVAQRYGTLRVG